ncbi:MAG: Asp-tRNA(Asn)/Glu-tRNA(Gln) amidotransferase subunit GatC [Thiobacillaceae bacterium]|nr:Asp-tRNA(Asn)/Glu-tRNA(Gln) amidotransferase subunit GatC [Thiobacillaceae bacterium]MCX7674030.1 Asp-tRNA(Asn)/Glu-tRNA(Gln) amidotransferase subunit GatC [Thiobacillaceae bacterium]MDW8324073.1 Asp-tRNA(Asn)/Glu-tRNA(Gln) amidotransferase subunit GatC [Burkholderiales bacterium]
MSLSLAEVQHIAHLARIRLDQDEAVRLQAQLNDILRLIEQMQAVDTAGVEPMAHAQEVYQRLRADVVTETDQRSRFQAVAPLVEQGLYLVPRVVE